MNENRKEEIIHRYVQAYNAFDVDGMIENLSNDIRFENISDGTINMTLNGMGAFRQQALRATEMFSEREQMILSFKHSDDTTQIAVSFRGVLAEDLPNGLQKGDEISLQGSSVFRFVGDAIVSITDIG